MYVCTYVRMYVWNGMEWNGMEWNGMECNAVQCSAMQCNAIIGIVIFTFISLLL